MAGTPVTTVAGGRENEAGRLPRRLCRFKAPTAAGGGSQRVRRVKKNLSAPPGTEELVNQLQRQVVSRLLSAKKNKHSFQLKNENPWFSSIRQQQTGHHSSSSNSYRDTEQHRAGFSCFLGARRRTGSDWPEGAESQNTQPRPPRPLLNAPIDQVRNHNKHRYKLAAHRHRCVLC